MVVHHIGGRLRKYRFKSHQLPLEKDKTTHWLCLFPRKCHVITVNMRGLGRNASGSLGCSPSDPFKDSRSSLSSQTISHPPEKRVRDGLLHCSKTHCTARSCHQINMPLDLQYDGIPWKPEKGLLVQNSTWWRFLYVTRVHKNRQLE